MKKYRNFSLFICGFSVMFLLFVLWSHKSLQSLGGTTFFTYQGGTGTSSPSGILYGDNTASSLKTVTIGSNLTFSGGTLSVSASGAPFPFNTLGSIGVSTSTLVAFTNGLISSASSTMQTLHIGTAHIPSLTSASLAVDSSGNVYAAATSTKRFYSFGYATTSWSGTTTQIYAPFPVAGTISNVVCTTNAGTLDVDWYYGPVPTHLAYIPTASTTANTIAFSTNNTPTANASSTVQFGSPVSSPTGVSCTATVLVPSL